MFVYTDTQTINNQNLVSINPFRGFRGLLINAVAKGNVERSSSGKSKCCMVVTGFLPLIQEASAVLKTGEELAGF